MKYVLYLLIVSGLVIAPANASFFDRVKKAATNAVEKEINEQIDSATPDRQPPTENNPPAKDTPQQTAPGEQTQPIHSEEDLYGLWNGGTVPAKSSLMDRVSLDILIMPDFASMRCSAAGSHCFAELTPDGTLGAYNAAILDQQATWGTRATVTFSDGGLVSVDWTDAPNTPADKRLYSGQLKKTLKPYPRRDWGSTPQQRQAFDVVGFTLGMTYEEAIAYRESNHKDLEPTVNIVRDDGSSALVYALKEKDARKMGATLFGEQVTLAFESLTPDELDVKQDPETLAQIAQREAIIKERAEAQQEMARQRRNLRTRGSFATQSDSDVLPEIPLMPKLRPQGADAQMLFVSRQVQFAYGKGPHKDNIIKALADKYGEPSIRIEPRTDRVKIAWIFDTAGEQILRAEGTAYDQLTKEPSAQSEKEKFYSVGLSAGRAGSVFNLVTYLPGCGLIVKAQLDTDTNGVVNRVCTTVYDSQRLLGDEWYRTGKLEQAFVAKQKAKAEAIQSRDMPDF